MRLTYLLVVALVTLTVTGVISSGNAIYQTQTDRVKNTDFSVDAKFALVKPSEKVVREALHATDLLGFKDKVGKEVTISGKVESVFVPKSKSVKLINFAMSYKDAITVVVKAVHFAGLPSITALKGKRVVVTGTCSMYQGRPQLELELVKQLSVIDENPVHAPGVHSTAGGALSTLRP